MDIYPKSVAEKLHALNSPRDKHHKRNSRHTEVGKYLQDLQAEPPIAWGKMDDVKWSFTIKCTKNVPIFVLICLMFLNVVLKIVSSLFNGAVPKKSYY